MKLFNETFKYYVYKVVACSNNKWRRDKRQKSLAVGKRRTTRQRMLNDLFTHEEEHRSKVWHQMLHGKPITYSIHVDPDLSNESVALYR